MGNKYFPNTNRNTNTLAYKYITDGKHPLLANKSPSDLPLFQTMPLLDKIHFKANFQKHFLHKF